MWRHRGQSNLEKLSSGYEKPLVIRVMMTIDDWTLDTECQHGLHFPAHRFVGVSGESSRRWNQ